MKTTFEQEPKYCILFPLEITFLPFYLISDVNEMDSIFSDQIIVTHNENKDKDEDK